MAVTKDKESQMKRTIPEPDMGEWCPFIKSYIFGGEPYCSFSGQEYPHIGKISYPCNKNWQECKIIKAEKEKG